MDSPKRPDRPLDRFPSRIKSTPVGAKKTRHQKCAAAGCHADADYHVFITTHRGDKPGYAAHTTTACHKHAPALLLKFAAALDLSRRKNTDLNPDAS